MSDPKPILTDSTELNGANVPFIVLYTHKINYFLTLIKWLVNIYSIQGYVRMTVYTSKYMFL